jgi:hypothetical protein
MKQLISKALLITSVLGMLSVPSCTQRQVGKGAAVVAVGTAIGAAVILDDANRNDDRYEYPRNRHPRRAPARVCRQVRECNTYYDRWGNARQNCRMVNRCTNNRRYFMELNAGGYEAIAAAITDKKVNEVVNVVDFAKAHDLSYDAAEKFSAALDDAKEGDFDKLEALGFDEKAVESLARLRFPSDESIEALSISLDQYEVLTKGMIGRMLTKARKYQEEIDSKED